jgi:pyrroline-5-carboxylate reductase
MRLVIIGGGNMGGAVARGAVAHGVLAARDIVVIEIDAARREALAELGCTTVAGVADLTVDSNAQLMLAVKPQMFGDVARALTPIARPRVVISIMAGLASSKIHHALGPAARIVRCMPNVACQLGQGMTAISLGMGAREGDESLARQIFDALGRTVMLDEALMHAVTAVSGSGPAYVFLLAEAMRKAAETVDLPEDVAQLLVHQTISGAAAMLAQDGADATALRKAVTSPHGTTEAALKVFEREGFEKAVIEAIRAARDRGIELNGSTF